MWPIFVEFRSATSEIIGGEKKKKEERRKKETLVKYKSADIIMSGGLITICNIVMYTRYFNVF